LPDLSLEIELKLLRRLSKETQGIYGQAGKFDERGGEATKQRMLAVRAEVVLFSPPPGQMPGVVKKA